MVGCAGGVDEHRQRCGVVLMCVYVVQGRGGRCGHECGSIQKVWWLGERVCVRVYGGEVCPLHHNNIILPTYSQRVGMWGGERPAI